MYPFDPRPWPFPSHITGSFAIQSFPSKTWSRSEGPQLWFCNVKGWTGCQLIPNKESRSIIWLWCSTCAQLLQVHSCIWLYQNHWPQRSDGVGWVLHDLRFRGQHWNFPESSAKLAVLCPAWHVRPETLVIQLTWDVVGQKQVSLSNYVRVEFGVTLHIGSTLQALNCSDHRITLHVFFLILYES